MSKSEQNALLDALKPLLWLTLFSGNSLLPLKGHSKTLIQWTLRILDWSISLLLVIYAFHLQHVLHIPDGKSCEFLIGLTFLLFYSSVALRICVGLWRKTATGLPFVKLLENYRLKSKQALVPKLKRTNMFLLLSSVALLLVAISLLAVLYLALVIPKDSVLVRVLMVTSHGSDTFSYEVLAFCLLSFFIGCGHLSQLWFLLFFCRLISNEFKTVSRRFRQTSPQDLEREIESIRGEYEKVLRLVSAVEDLLGFNLLFVFGAMVPNTCIFLFAIIQEGVEEADLFVIGVMALTAVAECALIVSWGIRINRKAHELTEDLYNVDLTNMPSDVISKISIFLTRLTASPIGISVAGLFVIDNSTILMLAGTLLTYVVVVIQTKPINTLRLPWIDNCTAI